PAVHGPARRPGGAALRRPDNRRRHPSRTAAGQRRIRRADVRRARPPGQGGRPMTTTAAHAPADGDHEETGPPQDAEEHGPDAFERDVLPAPPHASRTLLRSLLAPYRARVWLTAAVLLIQQAAVQAGPMLVAYALDRAVPALRAGERGPLIAVAVAAALCATLSGGLQFAFIGLSARVSQDVL